jgi:hypothetical protein
MALAWVLSAVNIPLIEIFFYICVSRSLIIATEI